MQTKYCPNCLKECTQSPLRGEGWAYACANCGILGYSPTVLLDTPDKEASKRYRVKEFLKKNIAYSSNIDEVVEEVIKLLTHEH